MFGVVEEVLPKGENTWPLPRSGHRMCADENFLYVFGGYDGERDHQLYNELWRYNITTENWVKLPDSNNMAPLQCASSTMLLLQKKILIFGGSGYPFGHTNSDKLFVYCLKTYQWMDLNKKGKENWKSQGKISTSLKADCDCKAMRRKDPPTPKFGHSMALSEKTGDIFIFSGTTGRFFTKEFHRFSLYSLTWDLIQLCSRHSKDIPCGRYRHEVVWNENDFFLFGGANSDIAYTLNEVYSFNFENLLWKKHVCKSNKAIPGSGEDTFAYPVGRFAHSCVIYKGYVYMVGGIGRHEVGEEEEEEEEVMFQDIWKFSLGDKQWFHSEKIQFPRKLHFHASAVTSSGCMFVFGGNDENFYRKADLHKMWLGVPSLKEQAWSKLVESLKKDKIELTREVLVNLGVPRHFHYRVDDSYLLTV